MIHCYTWYAYCDLSQLHLQNVVTDYLVEGMTHAVASSGVTAVDPERVE